MNSVLRHLRAAVLRQAADGPSDRQLLESFLAHRDEAAFAALLRRHGPMVLGVCRRVLGNLHDAEDAFQATFLVLARKAASIRPREMLGNWVYGVAHRTALKARSMNAKRRNKEKQVRPLAGVRDEPDDGLLERLDHELSRLPDKYRVPVVLCELEGRSRKEVARLLGLPEGTLSWRLAQARKMLARKLSRQGPALTGAALAAALAPEAASASLRASTARMATQSVAAGAVPARVAALTEGVIKTMLLTKLKITACAAALALLAGVGASGLVYRAAAEEPRRATRTPPAAHHELAGTRRPPADDLEALRLEIEALRLELRATRDRVRMLEEEVRGRQRQGEPRPRETRPSPNAPNPFGWAPKRAPGAEGRGEPRREAPPAPEEARPPRRKDAADPWATAEALARQLRKDPENKDVADALEKALKQLKEQQPLVRPDTLDRLEMSLKERREKPLAPGGPRPRAR